jgi:hypothetical protein
MAYASGKVNDLDDSNQQILSDINVQLLWNAVKHVQCSVHNF